MATAKKQEVRVKLHSKSHAVIADLISLEKQVVKSSKNKELIGQAAKSMVQQESALSNSENSLQKMQMMLTHLHYQADSIYQSFSEVNPINDQLAALKSGK
ncbi:BORCS7 [Bugula neritina]|uniref:BLOC-1-related complex subunit 7 n=1 Tax=Bugula neritina TaxID=10212 RepID=A0A7J7J654_BUGNE|nr:BORCS7 [Bugula neritina]